jgi:hypothetical protein
MLTVIVVTYLVLMFSDLYELDFSLMNAWFGGLAELIQSFMLWTIKRSLPKPTSMHLHGFESHERDFLSALGVAITESQWIEVNGLEIWPNAVRTTPAGTTAHEWEVVG